MKLKNFALAAVFALSASSAFADSLQALDFGTGNTASFSNFIDPGENSSINFDDRFTFSLPSTGSLFATLASSVSGADNTLSFARIYIEDSAHHQFDFSAQPGDDSVFELAGLQLMSSGNYTLHVQGAATDFTAYSGEMSVLASQVPEADGFAMMLAGLGLLAFTKRRLSK